MSRFLKKVLKNAIHMLDLGKLGKNLIILDGAMGTLLLSMGFKGCLEELNITSAEEIKRVHRAYSSADIILSNTFGLNGANYRGNYSLKDIAAKAAENARAAGKTVFFDVGPVRRRFGKNEAFKETYPVFKELARATCGLADGYFAETFTSLEEIKACVAALKEYSGKPVFASMTFINGEETLFKETPEDFAEAIESLGAEALGVNCQSCEETLSTLKRLARRTDVPLIAKPGLGLPSTKDGKAVYGMSAEKFEEYAVKFIRAGASAVGGCCGTTPEYINRIAKYSGIPVARRT